MGNGGKGGLVVVERGSEVVSGCWGPMNRDCSSFWLYRTGAFSMSVEFSSSLSVCSLFWDKFVTI